MSDKFRDSFRNLPFELKGPGSRMMKDFECVKKNFGLSAIHEDTHDVTLVMHDIEDSENYDSMTGKVTFDS
jgi:hypothetical protein